MTIYAIAPLIGAGLFLSLGAFVFLNKPSTVLKKIFSILCFETFLWQIIWFVSFFIKNQQVISYVAKVAYVPITFLPFTFYHFISCFLKISKKDLYINFFYIVALILLGLLFFSDYYVRDHRSFPWGNFAAAGDFYFIFLFSAIFALCRGVYLLIRATRNQDLFGTDKNQTRYLLLGMFVYSLCASDFQQVYGASWYPIGSIFFLVSFSIISYTLTKHNILDIEIIFKRTAVFAGLFAFVYGVFTTITIAGQEFFKDFLGWNQWLAMVPTVAIITFSLRPLETFLTNTTDKYLFQKKYDYRDLLKVFTNEILTVIDLKKLTQDTVESLITIMKLESASILLHDREAKNYTMVASHGVKEKGVVFKSEDLLISYHKKGSGPIQADKRVSQMEEGELKNAFTRLNAKICVPIELQDELIGVLGLGVKKSGEDFTQDDIDILMTLARTEAIAISNARLFEELSKTQAEAAQREKMAVIGTLAAGINHEICNPLGIVRGQCEMFLLNARDGFYSAKSSEDMLKMTTEIMNKVIKETDRATGITKKLASFAKPSKRSDFEEVTIEREVDEVVGLLGHDLKLSNIEIQKDFPYNFPLILADRKQIQEVLFNIIRNAAQAMDKKDGKIVLSGFHEADQVVVRIADNGSGIPPDKVEQIFHPFYTTKAPGKGTGLGLFIVKQVVERNKGTIVVESEVGVGTTFTLRFLTAVAALVNKAA